MHFLLLLFFIGVKIRDIQQAHAQLTSQLLNKEKTNRENDKKKKWSSLFQRIQLVVF